MKDMPFTYPGQMGHQLWMGHVGHGQVWRPTDSIIAITLVHLFFFVTSVLL